MEAQVSVASLGRGRKRRRNLMRTLDVVDDYGTVVAHIRRCPFCLTWQPLDREHFAPRSGESVFDFQAKCRECSRWEQRHRWVVKPEEMARRSRELRRRRIETRPGYLAMESARVEEARQRRIAANPEREARKARERSRRYLAKIMADPVKHRERVERQRIDRVLRRIDGGLPMTTKRADPGRQRGLTLPAAPVVAFIESLAGREGALAIDAGLSEETWRSAAPLVDLCERIGISDRTFRAWRSGERGRIHFDVVDRVLTRTEALWFDVFDADRWPDEHEEARQAFEGDLAIAG